MCDGHLGSRGKDTETLLGRCADFGTHPMSPLLAPVVIPYVQGWTLARGIDCFSKMARKQNIFQIAWSSECDDHAFDPVMCAIEVAQCGELWLVGMRLEMFTKELLERP
jgi:hypothetical protein